MSQTVIVFQEDCILAAMGKEGRYPALSKVRRIELQGQGDPFEQWQQALVSLRRDWKPERARLVLPAGLCSTRVMQLPESKGKQLAEMAARELEDSFRNEVADYSILHQEKKSNVVICAGGVDGSNLDGFLEICQNAGIGIDGITVPLDGYLQVLKYQEGREADTSIYLFFEEGSMTSILWQNGHYLYSSRSRLFSEPGTLDFGTEIVRSISGILQFYAGNGREQQIRQVYYAGCPSVDFEVSVEGIENLGLEVFPMEEDRQVTLPAGERASDWLSCVGAMVRAGRKGKRIDLYREGLKREEKEEKTSHVGKLLLLPLCTFGICLLAWIAVSAMNLWSDGEIRSKQEWIAKARMLDAYQQALELQSRQRDLDNGMAEVNLLKENCSTYPEFSGSLLQRIEAVGGAGMQIVITGYDVETGILQFRASSRELDINKVPDYIRSLQETGLFYTVDYTGYTLAEGWYTLALSCTLEGNEAEVQGQAAARDAEKEARAAAGSAGEQARAAAAGAGDRVQAAAGSAGEQARTAAAGAGDKAQAAVRQAGGVL